ncbi:hypothetical protein ACN42_g5660 [Penicillium freii]|uniref:FAD-binding domain-containing protein n=1 Tax=Penicillium freii TaxID=48697 RepID=A0A101MJ07_PENFR|nr:hypothetical protein ACN42_g5660 [Penicillium freii]
MGFQDKRVVVVGGGLGGMAFMNAALYAGVKNIQCYEQAHQFSEVGAGVDITANANRILDTFGLQDSLVSRSSLRLPYYMQYLQKRLTLIERNVEGFSDSPTYSGQVVYRGFVEYKDLPENTATLLRNVVNFRGPKCHLLSLPIGNPATNTDRVGVIGFMTESLDSWDSEHWMARAEITNLHGHVRDWCPQVQDIIAGLQAGSPDGRMMKQALYVRDPLAKWSEMNEQNAGNIFLGDAVHSTLPHQG